MRTSAEFERIASAWLAEGPEELADHVIDAALREVHMTNQRRPDRAPWRTIPMTFKSMSLAGRLVVACAVVIAIAAVVVARPGLIGSGGVSPAPSSSAFVSHAPESSPRYHTARFTVAGTSLQFTASLTDPWISYPFGAELGSRPAFFVSVVDNTFSDPCAHIQRSPKVGSTVEAVAKALGEIPGTLATGPVQTSLAGYAASYIELTIPASLPCAPTDFYLWQAAPVDANWWVEPFDSQFRLWILEVGARPVVIAARLSADSGDLAKAELQRVLESITFDVSPS